MSRIDRNNPNNNASARAQGAGGLDPYLVAGALSGNGRNPLRALAGELTQKLTSLLTMRRNMQAAEVRLDRMKAQVGKVEGQIAEVNKKDVGNRLNKLR